MTKRLKTTKPLWIIIFWNEKSKVSEEIKCCKGSKGRLNYGALFALLRVQNESKIVQRTLQLFKLTFLTLIFVLFFLYSLVLITKSSKQFAFASKSWLFFKVTFFQLGFFFKLSKKNSNVFVFVYNFDF